MTDDRDPRSHKLNEIIAEYLQAVENGEASSRDELLAQHPELADQLRAFLDQHDQLRQAMPAAPDAPSDDVTIPPTEQPRKEATLAPDGNGWTTTRKSATADAHERRLRFNIPISARQYI